MGVVYNRGNNPRKQGINRFRIPKLRFLGFINLGLVGPLEWLFFSAIEVAIAAVILGVAFILMTLNHGG